MRSNFEGFKAFADEVQRIEAAKRDFVVPMGRVAMATPDTVELKGVETFGLTANGHRQLAEKVGVPWDYYQKAAEVPGLREYNVNAWAQARSTDKKLVRVLDGNVRAVLGKNFKPMDNFMMLEAMLPAFREIQNDHLLMRTYALTEDHLYLQVGFPLTTRELVQPGNHGSTKQALMAGLTFRNSEVGKAKLAVRTTVWNLVCWNGLIAEEVLGMRHLGGELESGDDSGENGNIWGEDTLRKVVELIRLKIRDIVRDAMAPENLGRYVDKAQAAIGIPVEGNVEDAIVEVTKRLKFPLTVEETKQAAENVLTLGAENKNAWGIANGINALVKTVENTDRQYDLERFAADVIELKPGDWEAIQN